MKKKKDRDWQFWIGIVIIFLGTWFSYDSIRIFQIDKYLSGFIIGQGAVFILWGIREIVESLT